MIFLSASKRIVTEMKNWKSIALYETADIRQALQIIDQSSLQIALVVDKDNKLLGTITDGDIRRGFLNGLSLTDSVKKIYNRNPIIARKGDHKNRIQKMMKLRYIKQVPVLDDEGKIIRIELLKNILQKEKRENWVILMAGGMGTRLRPITKYCPKPLLSIGGKPVLELILENFINNGYSNIFIAVNYKAEMIENYFGDGSRWGIQILYLREKKRMGTAGALSLLPDNPDSTIVVMNGDLLTNINFEQLMDFHKSHGAQATMCVRDYVFRVPFGVAQIEDHKLINLNEKPVQRFFVNAGVYLLEPETLALIPKNKYYDMTQLYQKMCRNAYEVITFPIREHWMDIGQMQDLEQASEEYCNHFTN